MTIGEKMKKIRTEKGLSQKEVAKRLGVSQPSYAQYESGKRKPKFETIQKIAKALEVTFNELYGGPWVERQGNNIFLWSEENYNFSKDLKSSSLNDLTLAAHFDGDEFTEEELEDIRKYAEFVKSRRKEDSQ